MFDELVETQPHRSSGTNRKSYFAVSGFVLVFGLFGALIFSLFAVDLNLDMNEMDMVELVAPVDTTSPEKLPEPETAPKERPKSQPGPSAAPRMTTRQAIVASLDESPREAPSAISTVQNTEKARPATVTFRSANSIPTAALTALSDAARAGMEPVTEQVV